MLFYDLFDLSAFQQRLVGSAAADETEESAWAAVVAKVQQLEAQLGHQDFRR